MALTPARVAQILGAPTANVEANLPLVLAALDEFKINTPRVQVAALATIGVETPAFQPIRELSPRDEDRGAYFRRMYWDRALVRHQLGNTSPDDAERYFGRGFVQITGRDNYGLFGDLLGLDLLGNPDLALDPATSARLLACFFTRHQVVEAAEAGNWQRARIRVNGGLNGYSRFSQLVAALLPEAA